LIKRRGIDLVGTRQFGFHKPGCSGSDVTFNALYTGVGPILVGHQLRLHDGMAGLAAKGDRLGKMVGVVAADGADQKEKHTCGDEDSHDAAVPGTGEVYHQTRNQSGGAAKPSSLEDGAENRKPQPEKQESGSDEIGEDAEVRIARAGQRIENEEQ